jgi:D-threo-aldose 1-dehydrogenase
VLSTKVGRLPVPAKLGPPRGDDGFMVDTDLTRVFDFSADAVMRSLDQSLTRLGVGSIETVLVHDPDDHWSQASRETVPALCRLRDEGVIGAVGVGMNESAMPARFVAETDIDVVMCAGRYTLLDQSALDDLLPLAQERGVAVFAAGVFNSGLLANSDPTPDARYDYQPAPAALVRRARGSPTSAMSTTRPCRRRRSTSRQRIPPLPASSSASVRRPRRHAMPNC